MPIFFGVCVLMKVLILKTIVRFKMREETSFDYL